MLRKQDLALAVGGIALTVSGLWRTVQGRQLELVTSTPDAAHWITHLTRASDSIVADGIGVAIVPDTVPWLVLFNDYGCAYCLRAQRAVDSLIQRFPQLVVAEVVLTRFISDSALSRANGAALCSQQSGSLRAFRLHALSLLDTPGLPGSNWPAELTMDRALEECALAPATRAALESRRSMAQRLFIPGVPFVIGSKGISLGILTFDTLVSIAAVGPAR